MADSVSHPVGTGGGGWGGSNAQALGPGPQGSGRKPVTGMEHKLWRTQIWIRIPALHLLSPVCTRETDLD